MIVRKLAFIAAVALVTTTASASNVILNGFYLSAAVNDQGGFNDEVWNQTVSLYGNDFFKWGDPVSDLKISLDGVVTPLSNSSVTDFSTGSENRAIVKGWVGSDIFFQRSVRFDDISKTISVNDLVMNNTDSTHVVRTLDEFDPDQDIAIGGFFATTNDVTTIDGPNDSGNSVGLLYPNYKVSWKATSGYANPTVTAFPSTLWGTSAEWALANFYDPNGAIEDIGMGVVFDYGLVGAFDINTSSYEMSFSSVPEPSCLGLLALAGLPLFRRRAL
jgi:hypothetical protein